MNHIDHSGPESSGRMITWNDDIAQARSTNYRCNFCKRGFSNAQALGGHMNIHRRDRAKLKELSSENLLSLDITKSAESPPRDSSAGEKQTIENQIPDHDDHKAADEDMTNHECVVKENLERRLMEGPSTGNGDDYVEGKGGHLEKHVESGKVENSRYGELDLELRLGPEPQHAKSKP